MRRGEIFEQVLRLAEELPYEPSRELQYPRIADLIKQRAERLAQGER